MNQQTTKLRYIGLTDLKTDCVAHSNVVWHGPGDVQEVPTAKLKAFLKHPDVWEVVADDSDAKKAAGLVSGDKTELTPEQQADADAQSKADVEAAELEALRAEATSLGIEFKGNWGKPKLTLAIADAKKTAGNA